MMRPAVADRRPTSGSPALAHELDVQTAIIEHLEWCLLFNDRLAGHSLLPGQPSSLPGSADSKLGQWIRRAGSEAVGRHPAFAALRSDMHTSSLALPRSGPLPIMIDGLRARAM